MPAGQEGLDEIRAMQEGGFSDDEINAHVATTRAAFREGGVTDREADAYFGIPPFDPAPAKQHFENSFQSFAASRAKTLLSTAEGAPPAPEPEYTPAKTGESASPPKEADTFMQAIEAGFGISATGIIASAGKQPAYDVSDQADWYMRIAKQVGMVAGDIPANILGGLAASPVGLAAGPAAPLASIAAAGAGANALPAVIRSMYVNHLNKGEVNDFKDFWTKTSAVFLDTMKAAVVGGATMGAGGAVGGVVAKSAPILNTTAKLATEVGTMVTLGKALDGEVPKFRDFADAAILVGGLHGASKIVDTFRGPVPVVAETQVDSVRGGFLSIQEKLQQIYAKTGMKPEDVAQQAVKDPVLKQQLLSNSVDIPEAYKPLLDPNAEETTQKFEVPEKLGGGTIEVRKPDPIPDTEQSAIDTGKDTFRKFLFEQTGSAGVPDTAKPELSAAEKTVLERIGTQEKASKLPSFDETYTAALDKTHPIGQMVEAFTGGTEIKSEKDAQMLARLSQGNAGRATNFIENGPRDFDTLQKVEGAKGLKDILKPVAGNLDGFRAYLVSARDAELIPRGVKVGKGEPDAMLANAKEVLAGGKAKYEQAAQELYKYNNSLTDYLVKAGVVAKESSEAFKSLHQHYVPFFRIMDEESSRGAGKGMQVKNPIRAMLGSERDLVDPIESIIKNTFTYVELAERNRALRALVDTAAEYDAPSELIEKVNAPLKPIDVSPDELARFNKEFGIDGEVAQQAMTVFRPVKTDLASDEIAVFRDGKREVYKVPEAVAESIRGMEEGSANLFMRLMSVPAKATIFSRNGYIPFLTALDGMRSILTKDESYQNWLAGGGGGANLVSMDRNYINNHVLRLDPMEGVVNRMTNVLKTGVDFIRAGSELAENSTRVGEFKRAMRGKDGTKSDILSAAYESREVTLDFSRMGAKTQAFNQITAFFNAQVQGLDRLARGYKEDPIAMTAKITAAVTLPSIALWWANHTDPRWDEIPRWQKDLSWLIMTDKWTPASASEAAIAGKSFTRYKDGQWEVNKGNIYRIPKPNEVGLVFGSMIERTLEAFFKHDSAAYKDFSETMMQSFTPAYVPTALIPVVEQFSNKSTFTGSPIVPGHLEKGGPEVQYTEYTSETAKVLGKVIAPVNFKVGDLGVASPMVIDNYVRAWTGSLGTDMLKFADEALYRAHIVPEPPKPTASLADIPIIKAFVVRYPASNMRSITDFQEKYQAHQQLMNTIAIKQQKGDIAGAMAMRVAQENQSTLTRIDGLHVSMNRMKMLIEKTYQNSTIKPDEKRQLIDGMYVQMSEFAKIGNQQVEAVEKLFKQGVTR